MGLFTEPLNGAFSIEFNPSQRTDDNQPVFTGHNLVTDVLDSMGGSFAPGATEFISPREPFIEPEDK